MFTSNGRGVFYTFKTGELVLLFGCCTDDTATQTANYLNAVASNKASADLGNLLLGWIKADCECGLALVARIISDAIYLQTEEVVIVATAATVDNTQTPRLTLHKDYAAILSTRSREGCELLELSEDHARAGFHRTAEVCRLRAAWAWDQAAAAIECL